MSNYANLVKALHPSSSRSAAIKRKAAFPGWFALSTEADVKPSVPAVPVQLANQTEA
jgi:hypothetical protein